MLYILIQRVYVEGTLIYADIGPAAVRPIKPSDSASLSLDLDDSRVEYAKLNLKVMQQELSKSQNLHDKLVAENTLDGKLFFTLGCIIKMSRSIQLSILQMSTIKLIWTIY